MIYINIEYNTVLSSITKKLHSLYPNATIYKDFPTSMKYPNFYANQITVITTPDTQNYWWLDYLIAIEYREDKDLTTVKDLESKLDKISFELSENLFYIDDIKTWIKNIDSKKSDGILSFTFNIRLRARKEVAKTLMQQLKIDTKFE